MWEHGCRFRHCPASYSIWMRITAAEHLPRGVGWGARSSARQLTLPEQLHEIPWSSQVMGTGQPVGQSLSSFQPRCDAHQLQTMHGRPGTMVHLAHGPKLDCSCLAMNFYISYRALGGKAKPVLPRAQIDVRKADSNRGSAGNFAGWSLHTLQIFCRRLLLPCLNGRRGHAREAQVRPQILPRTRHAHW